MSITDHSRIAPSAFHLTVPCPGSLQLQELAPEQPDTEEIAEGKAAHHVAAQALLGAPLAVGASFVLEGRTWTVDEDMAHGAKLWADTMGVGHCFVEERVAITRVHPDCFGTPDAWRSDNDIGVRVVRVGDYKYGHRYVDPFENLQVGVGYAIGIGQRLNLSAGDDETVFEIVMVQPRAFHRDGPVQIWRTTLFKLNVLLVRVREAVALALSDKPPTQTGGHCRDCKARAICGTLRDSAAHIVDFSGTIEPGQLDATSAAIELRILDEAADRLSARRTGLAGQVEADLRAGRHVPFWQMQPGRSKLDWNADVTVDELRALGDAIGLTLLKPPTPITPTQAIDAGIDPSVMSGYATRKPGGVSLKPLDTTALRKIFAK
jgi:hypothetical protein